MQSEIVKQLQLASPEDIFKKTGITNWERKSQSYTKILYNNPLLRYDDDAIYCIDKLHLTYKILNDGRRENLSSKFWSKKQHDINEYITVIPDNRRPSYYYYSFSIVVEDVHFGRIKFCQTRDLEDCLIEIDNEVLYCQPAGWIIASIYKLAQTFGLVFNNISEVEIARDSNTNLPRRFAEVYHHSVHCHDTINGDQRYFQKVTKCSLEFFTDDNDPSEGTLNIGKSSSNVFVKGYNKTKEIRDKREKKRYIQQIYNSHLDSTKDVYRLEITAKSGSFSKDGMLGKKDVDLLYLLDKSDLPLLFFHLLGEKLEFKDLRTKRWVNRNDHYDRIRLLEPPSILRFKEIPVKPIVNKYSHDGNINHTKMMINQYLDRKIGYSSLVDFTIRAMKEYADFAWDFRSAFNKVQKNHKNKIPWQDHRKLEKLCSGLRKNIKRKSGLRLRILLSAFF